jgi:phosphatidylinositol alpha-mannosyltransferase
LALNIGIVSEYYYPLLGGISENVHHTATELVARGHHVTIVSAAPDVREPAGLALPNGIPTVHIGRSVPIYGNGALARFAVGPHLWRDVNAVMNEHRFDIVQLHSPLFFTLPPLAALAARCPRVGTFHSYFDRSIVYSVLNGVLQRHFVERLQGITVVSPSVLQALSRYFVIDARVIPNGVDVRTFSPDVPRLARFGPEKRTLLFLGRFDPRNGLGFMLRAFAQIRRRVPDVRLIVVGTGPLEVAYRKMVADGLADDVHFEGPALLERPSYYATADIFCSTISKASFGITLLEAMASGVPIVATDNVGYRDLLGSEEAMLVPHDVDLFADAVVRLLADDRLRTEMGAAGRKKAIRYAWPAVVSQLLDYFNEILACQ